MQNNSTILGVDIGGTFTKIGLVTSNGELLKRVVFNTMASGPFEDFIQTLKSHINAILSQHRNREILGVGIGAPNANFYSGCMEMPPNFNWGDSIPLVKTISELLNLPVFITNDANAAALGELKFGAAKEMKNFIVLTLGTGLGSGIVVNGEILHGARGMAGELGHVSVKPNGRICRCGLNGCLEAYASVTGVKRTVFKFMAEWSVESPLRKISFDNMTGVRIAEAALAGDPIALKAFDYTAEILGSKMADFAAYLDPEAIILAGGLTKAGDILLEPARRSMENNMFNAYKGKIKLLISELKEGSGILGAAALAMENLK